MKHDSRTIIRSAKGITATELLFVLAIIAILVAIAFPPFLQWRQTLEYRSTARDIVSILRNAQSRTVTANLQHRIEFETASAFRRYRMTEGNFAANSTAWGLAACPTCVIQDWTPVPTSVTLQRANLNVTAGNENISFNSDGTAVIAAPPAATITVRDNTNTVRFTINVTNMGRVSIRTGP